MKLRTLTKNAIGDQKENKRKKRDWKGELHNGTEKPEVFYILVLCFLLGSSTEGIQDKQFPLLIYPY